MPTGLAILLGEPSEMLRRLEAAARWHLPRALQVGRLPIAMAIHPPCPTVAGVGTIRLVMPRATIPGPADRPLP